jgi:oxygen-independent coproporphyrinogen-3 oxidase
MSLDLLYGLPGQTLEHWRLTLRQAMELKPEHISLYQLNIEPETVLARRAAAGEACAGDEEVCRQQYLLAHELLTSAGFRHYEISSYALPGKESRHNTLYWRNGHYLGLGAGAAGYLPAAGARAGAAAAEYPGLRYTNAADLTSYLAALEHGRLPAAEQEEITPALARGEELMLAFRISQGIEAGEFRRRRGLDLWQEYGPLLEKHLAAGWLKKEAGRFCPTLEGWLAYNYWVQEYL